MSPIDRELEQERKDAIEHRDALMDIRAILATTSGRRFLKYLFKSFEVCELPEVGLDGTLLHDKLGFLRAGNSIFKIVSEANREQAGIILAEVEKERYEKIYAEYITGPEQGNE